MTPGTDTEHLPFFVYGTLRPGERNHAAHLADRVLTHTPAHLPDAVLYDGPGYPYAVETPGGGPVHGDLITPIPSAYEAVRAALDRLEDYAPGDPYSLYERVAREVRCADGAGRRAWVYVAGARLAAGLRATGVLLPEGRWPPDTGTVAARPTFEDEAGGRSAAGPSRTSGRGRTSPSGAFRPAPPAPPAPRTP